MTAPYRPCPSALDDLHLGGSVERDSATDVLWVNREFTVSIVLARCHAIESGHNRWKIRLDSSLAPDISVAARLDGSNQAIRDYYLLPRVDFGLSRISLAEQNAAELESYPPSSKASSARWPVNTAASSRPRCSPASAA